MPEASGIGDCRRSAIIMRAFLSLCSIILPLTALQAVDDLKILAAGWNSIRGSTIYIYKKQNENPSSFIIVSNIGHSPQSFSYHSLGPFVEAIISIPDHPGIKASIHLIREGS